MSKYLEQIIAEGEHQQQDFKYAINDSRKIAKSLVAFANTDGGRLLVGVKDNGAVVGVADDEEFYMVEAAAQLYCRPPVVFQSESVQTRTNKTVLIITIPKSEQSPHYAQADDGRWWVYFRQADENILASKMQIEVLKKKKSPTGAFIHYTEAQRLMLEALANSERCTLSRLARVSRQTYQRTEKILVQLIVSNVVKMVMDTNGVYYILNKDIKQP